MNLFLVKFTEITGTTLLWMKTEFLYLEKPGPAATRITTCCSRNSILAGSGCGKNIMEAKKMIWGINLLKPTAGDLSWLGLTAQLMTLVMFTLCERIKTGKFSGKTILATVISTTVSA